MINIAKQEYAKSNFVEALNLFQDALQNQPNSTEALEGMARCFYRLKRFDDAVINCDQAISMDKSLAWPHLILSYIKFLQKKMDESKQHAELSIDRDPFGWETNFWWGSLLDLEYKTDDGLAFLKKAVEGPKDTWYLETDAWYLYNSLSRAYFNKGDLDKYHDALKQMNKLKPSLFNSITIHLGRWAILYSLLLISMHYIGIFFALISKLQILLVIPSVIDVLWLIGGGWYVYRHQYKTGGKLIIFGLCNSIISGLVYLALHG